MAFLTDKEILDRVSSPDNLANRVTVHKIEKGKREGDTNIPKEIKKTIAILTNEGETQQSVADTFGVSRRAVGFIESGRPGGGNLDPELDTVIKDTKSRVKDSRNEAELLAINALLEGLKVLPKEMMTGSIKKAKSLSSISKDMAFIANQMSGKDLGEGNKSVHLHLYAPRQKAVEEYETIDV
jgi:DNA-binding XRE family transcriptional regulator